MKKADITFSFFGTRIVQKLIYYGLVDCASEQGFKRLKGTLHDSLFQNYNPWFSGCAGKQYESKLHDIPNSICITFYFSAISNRKILFQVNLFIDSLQAVNHKSVST